MNNSLLHTITLDWQSLNPSPCPEECIFLLATTGTCASPWSWDIGTVRSEPGRLGQKRKIFIIHNIKGCIIEFDDQCLLSLVKITGVKKKERERVSGLEFRRLGSIY